MNNAFPKSEHLCGQIRIAALYKEGQRFTAFPLRVTFRRLEGFQPPMVLVWAPKSLFKHAVDRNRLRRLMREAYRLNAQPLRDFCQANNWSFLLAFNYMDPELRSGEKISSAMRKAIGKLINRKDEPSTSSPSSQQPAS